MNILFVSAEVAPFVSVGGLSQVMYFLPQALRKLGHDVRVFTPKYGTMDETALNKTWKLETEMTELAVPLDNDPAKALICNIKSYQSKQKNLLAYFLENREYYELRANVFGYKDDHTRFALLSKGCLEWLLQSKIKSEKNDSGKQKQDLWWPDIIHCHDWHTAYLIDFARRNQRYQKLFENTSIVLTVHNFHFQGNFDFQYAPKEEFDYARDPLAPLDSPHLQKQNALKRGLIFADAINTVSQTHAVEVLTPEYAEGLENVLYEIRAKLTGILNGLDTKLFDPARDKKIKRKFSSKSFVRERTENKKSLQRLFGLPVDSARPLLALSGRLTKQKGLDLLLEVLPHLLLEKPELQIVVIGSGDERYRLELGVLKKNFPNQVGLHLRPDFNLPRIVFSGADMVIIPSIFEPGGIVALEAMRYGCVPVVRRTGGLNDIVTDFNPSLKSGNGFSFKNIDSWALFGAIIESLTIYGAPMLWKELVKNCMLADFSWNHAAGEYDRWYKSIVEEKPKLSLSAQTIQKSHQISQLQKT